jgi:L-amino acid N-acyltransferase YncA
MEWVIRPVRPDDADAIVRILNPIIEAGAYTVFDTPLTVEYERDYIANLIPRGFFYVAEDQDHRVVGFQSGEPYATYTHAFDHVAVIGTYVDLKERQRGIGTRLFEATLEAARRKGYEKIFTFVRSDNVASLIFYLKLGFRIIGTVQRQVKLEGKYIDEVLIERLL